MRTRGWSSWWSSNMAVIGWMLLVSWLVLQLAEAHSDCGPVDFFVPRHDREIREDYVVKVTYRNGLVGGNLTEERRETSEFLQCCWSALPDSAIQSVEDLRVGTRRSRSLSCSILSPYSGLDTIDSSGATSSPDFCLRSKSSLNISYIVGNSGRGHGKIFGCDLKAEAVLSLFLYLKWFWPVPLSGMGSANRPPFLASVQTRGECSSVPCRLTVSKKSQLRVPEVSSMKFSSGYLGTVEWFGALSDKKHVLLLQEYEAALSLQTETIRSVESASMRTLQSNSSTKIVYFSLSTLSPMLSIETPGEGAFQLGRRSLLARAVKGADSSFEWSVFVIGTLLTLSGISMLAILCAGKKEHESPAEFLDTVPILPPRYSFSKLQRATRNFSQKLGDGAFGSVYEGSLPNGIRVAVKMLEKTSVQGEKQFRAEVASMGAIRHLNLVRLHGFCSEGTHRLLVYEFMPNGSLDSWLFGKKQGGKLLDWEQRLNIAVGTARALAYLHEECSDHIIHLDVKPENILLDHQFCPKLSDFGLAKLMDREQSRVVTSMRGTPGYLAPEWLLPHAAVTAKTDVYSFGMVLLELISGRENTNFSLGKEQWYFPAWAFKLMGEGRTMELLDNRLHVEEVEYFHKQDAVRAIHVALLCIQDDPEARPPMSRVLHMLQGHVEPEPLNVRQASIQPPRRLLTAFAASKCDTNPENKNSDKNDKLDSQKNSISNDQQLKLSNDHQLKLSNDHQLKLSNDHQLELSNDHQLKLSNDHQLKLSNDHQLKLSNDHQLKLSNDHQLKFSNDHQLKHNNCISDPPSDMRNDHYPQRNDMNMPIHQPAVPAIVQSHLPGVAESPRLSTTEAPPELLPRMPALMTPQMPPQQNLENMEEDKDSFMLDSDLPAATQQASLYRSSKGERLPGAHTLGSNPKCIPPWPVKGDVILLRGPQGDFHGVVRDVRTQTKMMRLGILHRLSSETRWSVREEETIWRHWNESIRTLDFWTVIRWATIPGRGIEKFPIEWQQAR